MQNIIVGIIMSFLLFPGSVFAASGPAGTVETLSATYQGSSKSATMRASVYTEFKGSKIYFDYGTSQALGERTNTRIVGRNKEVLPSLLVFRLTPNTTYYYRAVLEGSGGTTYGEIRSFMTTSGSGGSGENSGGTDPHANISGTSGNGQNTNVAGSGTGNSNQTGAVGNALSGDTSGQTQSSGAIGQNQNPGGFFQRLFDSFTRARPVQLSIAMNPEKPKAREIIEYVVSYQNTSNQPVSKGELSVVIPDSVVYLSDNSGGRATLSKVAGGQKLTMVTEPLSGKGKNAITVMAITGSSVGSASPTAIASIGYRNAQGDPQYLSTNKSEKATPLIAATGAAKTSSQVNTTASAASSGGILPNSFFEWLIFLGVVTGIIVIIRRVLAVYQERKKRILEESRELAPSHA